MTIQIKRSANRFDEAKQFGFLASMFLRGDFRDSLAPTLEVLRPAIWHEQVLYFSDEYQMVCGVALWATLTEKVEKRLLRGDKLDLHESEWNEGDRYWVVAIATARGRGREVLQSLRREMLGMTDTIRFCRKKPFQSQPRIRAISHRAGH
jgi:hemolysin-activating ACP:hemolysin acyltransferase